MANKQVRNVMKFYIVVLQTCTVWNLSVDIIQFMNTCIFGQSFVKSFGVILKSGFVDGLWITAEMPAHIDTWIFSDDI